MFKSTAEIGGPLVTSQKLAKVSSVSNVAGSKISPSAVLMSLYSIPTITEAKKSKTLTPDEQQQKPCSGRQRNEHLLPKKRTTDSHGKGSSLTTLQQEKHISERGSLICTNGQKEAATANCLDYKLVMIKEVTTSLKCWSVRHQLRMSDRKHVFFCCMLCEKNVSTRTRGQYEFK